jgi:hypothetical protein
MLVSGLAAIALVVGVGVGVCWLVRRPPRAWLEERFGHLRARREAPGETYSVEETMREVSKWL